MNEIENVKNIMKSPKIVISRVPEKTKQQFMSLADREFCGDYGMTLKWIMDQSLDERIEWLRRTVLELSGRIDELEQKPANKQIKSLAGTIIRKGGE